MTTRPGKASTLIFLVEDDENRVKTFRSWLPDRSIRIVWAKSAGQALGALRLDADNIHGILLDHDLDQNLRASSDAGLSGTDVARAIIRYVPRHVPVLVHSMNGYGRGEQVTSDLQANGFAVERIRFAELTREQFVDWLEDARADG